MTERWYTMSGKSDQVKGRAKEAAGILTGNKDLEAEGKADRLTGEAEERIEHAKDKANELIDQAKGKVDEAADKAKDALHRD
ncbi:MAG: CsbD family protein [Aeromicrobium sp.]